MQLNDYAVVYRTPLKKVTEPYFCVLPGGDVDEEVPIEVHQRFLIRVL